MEKYSHILKLLPYKEPFLFVDGITVLTEDEIEGYYTFKEEEYFYKGHFKDIPVTPGVILTECMAQISLVCLGIHLLYFSNKTGEPIKHLPTSVAFTESHVFYERPVFPGEKIRVTGKKMYWRMGKLKCGVEAWNERGERLCYGTLSGFLKKEKY